MPDFLTLSKQRYTTKHYDPSKMVSDEDLKTLLAILRNTPSSLNMQPWHFAVLNNTKEAAKILPAVDEFNHERITHSSYTIVFCVKSPFTEKEVQEVIEKEDKDGRYPTQKMKHQILAHVNKKLFESGMTQQQREQWAKDQVFIALGAFLYAAASLNMDSTAIGGFNNARLDDCLNLKEQNLKSVVLATIGYRSSHDSNANRPKSRLEFNELFTIL